MKAKRKSPVGVKIIACLLMLASLSAFLMSWMKLSTDVGAYQIRMSPGEILQEFLGMDAAAVKSSAAEGIREAGGRADTAALNDLLDRVLDGRFRLHELGILCRDGAQLCKGFDRYDAGSLLETASYAVWGITGLLALLGLIALICQLTDHRWGILPYFLLGALIAAGLLLLRRELNDYLVRESDEFFGSLGLDALVSYLGIDVKIVKMGIGAYLSPFLALQALLLMGIRKKEKHAATPYPARRETASGETRPARPSAAAQQARPEAPAVRPGWVCPNCGRRNGRESRDCQTCGMERPRAANAVYCPNCGRQLPGEAVYCSDCGARVH